MTDNSANALPLRWLVFRDGAGPSSLVRPTGEDLADQRSILRSACIAGGLARLRGSASFSAGKKNLKRRLLEVYPDGSALVEVASGQRTRLMREILGRVQRRAGGRLAQPPPRLCLRPSHQFDQPFEFRLSRVHC